MTRAIACPALLPMAEARSEPVPDAVLAWEGDRITYAGPRSTFDGEVERTVTGAVVPGFVDCHTHLPFFGWRDDEFEMRLAGRSYRDLHGTGGIPRSARMLAEASDDEVLAFSTRIAQQMLAGGTTALELKTGYGLTVDAELRHARLARELASRIPQTATVTLLAGHAVPDGVRREEWVRLACSELIPGAAAEGLVDALDVYVEDIAFTVDDLNRFAAAAAEADLPLRVHADQLANSHAASAAAALGARSADHLNHVDDAGIAALAASETTAVLLPASTLLLRSKPPSPDLVSSGARLALATDCNPGTSAVTSMPLVIGLACAMYGMDPRSAISAATRGSAQVLGLEEEVGALTPGRRADFVVLSEPGPAAVPYRLGEDSIAEVWIGGSRVFPF